MITNMIIAMSPVGSAKPNSPDLLKCDPFTKTALPAPAPQQDQEAIERLAAIERQAGSGPHTVLFLGDSLTQKWDTTAWEHYFAPFGTLNAGVNGDRTEHLLWRLARGTFDEQHPRAVVLLIGTNDIGRNRPAAVVAEGVRANLRFLRTRLPDARILLLGILPRGESPSFLRRRQVAEVNKLIQHCADGQYVHYVDFGNAILDDNGILRRAVSPDGVHLSPLGYALFAAPLRVQLNKLLSPN